MKERFPFFYDLCQRMVNNLNGYTLDSDLIYPFSVKMTTVFLCSVPVGFNIVDRQLLCPKSLAILVKNKRKFPFLEKYTKFVYKICSFFGKKLLSD